MKKQFFNLQSLFFNFPWKINFPISPISKLVKIFQHQKSFFPIVSFFRDFVPFTIIFSVYRARLQQENIYSIFQLNIFNFSTKISIRYLKKQTIQFWYSKSFLNKTTKKSLKNSFFSISTDLKLQNRSENWIFTADKKKKIFFHSQQSNRRAGTGKREKEEEKKSFEASIVQRAN